MSSSDKGKLRIADPFEEDNDRMLQRLIDEAFNGVSHGKNEVNLMQAGTVGCYRTYTCAGICLHRHLPHFEMHVSRTSNVNVSVTKSLSGRNTRPKGGTCSFHLSLG